MNTFLHFDPILLLYFLLGMASFWLYFRKLGTARLPRYWSFTVLAVAALIHTVLINNIAFFVKGNNFYSTHNFAYALLHLSFLFAVILIIRNIRWDQAFYHALLFFMCTRYFDNALGVVTGFLNIFYLNFSIDAAHRILGLLLVSALYLIISLLLAQYVDMREAAPLKRARLTLISFFALALEMMNYLTVVTISPQLSKSNAMLGMALMELLCGFTALIFIIYNEISLQKAQEQSELNQIRLLMEKHVQQYKQQQNVAFTIDRKYHDLKHHLDAVKALKTNEARQNYIAELETSIKNYETFCYTGNEILDTILGEKLLYCSQHNIRLIMLVDGDAVSFVHPTDLVAIFGNALDNAIEAVSPLEGASLREIIVRAVVRDNWIVLRFENHSSAPLVEKNGILLTTKQDSSLHGFGFKSISYVAKKYGGHCTYTMENNLFVLTVLLARPQEQQA